MGVGVAGGPNVCNVCGGGVWGAYIHAYGGLVYYWGLTPQQQPGLYRGGCVQGPIWWGLTSDQVLSPRMYL